MKKKSGTGGIVFSTDPVFKTEEERAAQVTLEEAKQPIRVKLDKKQRAGKAVTLMLGFVGSDKDLEELGRRMRNFCGTGGSIKDGHIIIQGDQRDKILQWLHKNGYVLAKLTG